MSNHPAGALALGAALIPAAASATPLRIGDVLMNAAPLPKLIMLALAIATLVALVVTAGKLVRGRRLEGGSAFVSGLRLGGPIAGLLGAAYGAANISLGIANVPFEPTLKVLAPGFAEIAVMIGLGFAVGALAVIMHWALEARIDRQVLSA